MTTSSGFNGPRTIMALPGQFYSYSFVGVVSRKILRDCEAISGRGGSVVSSAQSSDVAYILKKYYTATSFLMVIVVRVLQLWQISYLPNSYFLPPASDQQHII